MKPFESLFLCFFILIFFGNTSDAQCPPGAILLASQQEINDFVTQYPNCAEIVGNIQIGSPAVNDLSPLTQLTSIEGTLRIEDSHLTDLTGLNNLTSIRSLLIGDNDSLVNLVGLENIDTLGILNIGNYSAVTFLPNKSLISLAGLDNVAFISDMIIGPSPALTDLTSLSNLTSVFYLDIFNIPAMSLTGLDNLASVEHRLSIGGCPNLTDITALNNLMSVEDLVIVGNNSLNTLIGIANIDYNTITNLTIADNEMLSFCQVESICGYLANGGVSSIQGNAPNCDSPTQVLDACDGFCPTPINYFGVPAIVFNAQQDIDDFVAQYPDCTEIPNLIIQNPAVNDLNSLTQLTSIIGTLGIEGTHLTDLTGLDNLTSLGRLVVIDNDSLINLEGLENITTLDYVDIGNQTSNLPVPNEALTSLKGLDNLTSVGTMFIGPSPALNDLTSLNNLTSAEAIYIISTAVANLNGLENLTSIEADFQIIGNSNLTDLNSLENLTSVGDELRIVVNGITNLNGLESLTSVGGNLEIIDNDSLVDISGLNSLTSTGGLEFSYNDNLSNLTSLNNLTSVEGGLQIIENISLNSLAGLENLNHDILTDVSIFDNPNLSICDVESICNYLENNGISNIYDNASDCNSAEEILALCTTVSTTTPDNLPQIIISPNPTNDTFTIQGIPQGTYQIHDTTGRIIQSGNMENDLSIDISTEAQGVYFISIQMENETITKRIIKM